MTTPRHEDAPRFGPHAGQPVRHVGPAPERAPAALVLLHGRGGSAEDMLALYGELGLPEAAALAPQAAGPRGSPLSSLAPVGATQPSLDSALAKVESIVSGLLDRGVRGDRIALLGFSQGACLTSEFVARSPR